MDARASRYSVCDRGVAALLLSGQRPSAVIWTEKGQKIQDVAAFQEKLKGKSGKEPTFSIVTPICDGWICASQERFTDEAKEEKSSTLPANFRSSKVRGSRDSGLHTGTC